ncbi:MAG: outer membrane beta-barrel protein [Crocinitomicaceae bacterium]|jgi:hypothetical protein|nr:outer membrane beta-barrel protein [Crocinitomicaceae bacterium]MDP4761646.1 outer membrane beta-barrel protein [Crocinitomicaceae bacterium]
MRSISIKRLASAIFSIFLTYGIQAQTVGDKSLQAGMVGGVGVSMLKMGTNYLSANGVGATFTVGTNFTKAFKESKNLAYTFGLEFDIENLKFKKEDANVFYRYTDKVIKSQKETVATTDKYFLMSERTYNPVYISLPIYLNFRTEFIGDFRYFANFGLRNRFLVSNKINDTGFSLDNLNDPLALWKNQDNIDMSSKGELFIFNSNIGFSAGAEWNFAGTTVLKAEIGYYYGFVPLFLDRSDDKKSLFILDNDLNKVYFSNKSTQNQVALKFSILF